MLGQQEEGWKLKNNVYQNQQGKRRQGDAKSYISKPLQSVLAAQENEKRTVCLDMKLQWC
eukprot:12843602-Ditylum_brightwellii.AAC.1